MRTIWILAAMLAGSLACGPSVEDREPAECYPIDPWIGFMGETPGQTVLNRGFCQWQPNQYPDEPLEPPLRYLRQTVCVPSDEASCTGLCEDSDEIARHLREEFAVSDGIRCENDGPQLAEDVIPGCREYYPDTGFCCYSAVLTAPCWKTG